jgi:SRSO17 transposase
MEQVKTWVRQLDTLLERLGHLFARSEARRRVKAYLQGLLSPAQRKNSWQLAEAVGDETPYGIQQFLYRARWDADALRDEMRAYVVENLGDDQAILIVDETGFVKKGSHSVGVQRQYSGTAGRIENCQIGVFLAYASQHGHTFIDRALYLPEEWAEDRERRRRAGVPEEVTFTSKPNQAWQMLHRAVEHDVPFAWVTADTIYGDYRRMRLWLEGLPKRYVLAVSAKETVILPSARELRVKELREMLPTEGWSRLSAGEGAKGPRWYDWLRVPLMAPLIHGWARWLLVRRSLTDPSELATYVCFAPEGTSLETLVKVAGHRWTIESCFEEAKGEVGLDEYEVRSWTGWYRHVTLSCLAHAFLAVMRSQAPDEQPSPEKGGPWSQPPTTDSLAAFKASRGLSSR